MKRQSKLAVAGVTGAMLIGAGTGLVLNLPSGAGASGRATQATTGDTTGTSDSSTSDSGTSDSSTGDSGTSPTPPTGRPDRGAFLEEQLAKLVEDGTITQAQADAIIAGIQANRPDAGDQDGDGPGMGGPGMGGPGMGGHGHGGPGGMGGGRGIGFGIGLDAAATALGVSTDDLKAALQDGKTIADVATEQGVDVQQVIDAIVAAETEELTQRVTDAVNGVRPTPPADGQAPGDDADGGSGSAEVPEIPSTPTTGG